MKDGKTIKLSTPTQQYTILIQKGLFHSSSFWIRRNINPSKVLILTDRRVEKLYGNALLKEFGNQHLSTYLFSIPNGEIHKNKVSLFAILDQLRKLKFQRDACLLTLGGGVVGDLGGFAASIYMRGISLLHVPTTLLSQVDASIGGKTAIDFGGIKNLIGSFYQPKGVLIDPGLLSTLDERNIRTGLAEIIKYGIIYDARFFNYLEKKLDAILRLEPASLLHSITRSAEIKAAIVSKDEKEKGNRAWLNYGHTLGHALEAFYEFGKITHGEAIAVGMRFAALLANRLGLCDKDTMDRQESLLRRAVLLRKLTPFDLHSVYEKMALDKKTKGGKPQFILTRKIGLVSIQKNLPSSAIFSALRQVRAEACESS